MKLQNPKVKTVQSDLTTLLSIMQSPALFTGKKLYMDFLYLYQTESLSALTYDPVTHPRWKMYKVSKLQMREIKCIHDKSFPPPITKCIYANPGQ